MCNNAPKILWLTRVGLPHLQDRARTVLGKIDEGPSSAKYLPDKPEFHIRFPGFRASTHEKSKEQRQNYYSRTVSFLFFNQPLDMELCSGWTRWESSETGQPQSQKFAMPGIQIRRSAL